MSYCVNCGVELDETAKRCPLCNTKVVNPSAEVRTDLPTPYPIHRETISQEIRKDMLILTSVILFGTAIVCGVINYFLLNGTNWSLYIIGACILLYILLLPLLVPRKIHPYFILLLDGLGFVMYFAIIAWQHPGNGWFLAIALPLIILCTLLCLLLSYGFHHPGRSILFLASVIVVEIAVLTLSIELLARHYIGARMTISWSAIVLACCIIIDATLITILRRTRLREEVRRRMHI